MDKIPAIVGEKLLRVPAHDLASFRRQKFIVAIDDMRGLKRKFFAQAWDLVVGNGTKELLHARPIPAVIPGYDTAIDQAPGGEPLCFLFHSHRIGSLIEQVYHVHKWLAHCNHAK